MRVRFSVSEGSNIPYYQESGTRLTTLLDTNYFRAALPETLFPGLGARSLHFL